MSELSYSYHECLHDYLTLSKRDRHILHLYLVSRMPWADIARKLGVSRERVRQIKNRIFWKLGLDLNQEKRRASLVSIAKAEWTRNEYQRTYYKEHREKKLAYSRRYRETHHEEVRAKDRNHYRKNKEKRLEACRSYSKAHPERIRTISRKYYYAHRDEISARQKAKREKLKERDIKGV